MSVLTFADAAAGRAPTVPSGTRALARCSVLAERMLRGRVSAAGRPGTAPPPADGTVSLGDALRYLSAHFNLASGGPRLEVVETHPHYRVVFEPSGRPSGRPAGTDARRSAASTLAGVLGYAREATGRPVQAVRVELRRPVRSPHGSGGPPFDGAPIRTPAAADALTLRDPYHGPDHGPDHGPRRERDWIEDVRALIADGLPGGDVTLPGVAARLAMSPRTLQRRLRDAGTSWRDELEDVRGRSARRLLEDGGLTRASVARRLGYSDARSLRRALRRWDGPQAGPR